MPKKFLRVQLARQACSWTVLFSTLVMFTISAAISSCGDGKVITLARKKAGITRDLDSSSTISEVPLTAASSVVFSDTSDLGGVLGGTITITRASDERSITDYVIYWGADSSTILAGLQPIATLSKSLPELSFNISGTLSIPLGASHILVRTKNSKAEMKEGVSTLIIDRGVPRNAAVSLGFKDRNLAGGKLDGDLQVAKASIEDDITHYVVYWGSDLTTKLFASPIASLPKTGGNLTFTFPVNTSIPKGASHFLVFTKNDHGEMAFGIGEKIVDLGVPVNQATAVSFTDQDPSAGTISGAISISKAANEADLSHYVLYWGNSPTSKLSANPIASIAKSDPSLSFALSLGTMKPAGASHILVLTKNADGEMSSGVSTPLIDNGVPSNPAVGINFVDGDLAGGKLQGDVVITKALDETDITHYVLYLGSSPSVKFNATPIATIVKTPANPVYTLPIPFLKPTTATHFLVYTKNYDGEMATPIAIQIIDKGVPVHPAASVTFIDEDLQGGQIAGIVNITKAADESDVNEYVLYWGSNATTKLNATPIRVLGKSLTSLQHIFTQGTPIPASASHLLVFTRNVDGEMAGCVSASIIDNAIAQSLTFADNDPQIGKIGGRIQIARAVSEASVTDYVLYWGMSSTTKLNNTPIQTIPKTVANIQYDFPLGTIIPLAATHFLVFTKTPNGEMASGVSLPIVDSRPPANTAVGLTFVDTSYVFGTVGGSIGITKALDETYITDYVLYWGSSPTVKLNPSPLATLPKSGNLIYDLAQGTPKPSAATYFLVFTRNGSLEMATGISVPINDLSVPVNAPVSVSFSDTFAGIGKLGGSVVINKAVTEIDVTHYVIYWGSSATAKLANSVPIASLVKTGANLTYRLPFGIAKPTGATHFLVFTKNAQGEMPTGVNILIRDR